MLIMTKTSQTAIHIPKATHAESKDLSFNMTEIMFFPPDLPDDHIEVSIWRN